MLPVLVGKKKRDIERGVRDFGINVAILDDGFQVRNVRKDVELLIIDGEAQQAALHLFPLAFFAATSCKEKKADIILVSRGELDSRTKAVAAAIPVFRVRLRPALHLRRLKDRAMVDYRFTRGKKVCAF